MGRRSRRREQPSAPVAEYRDAEDSVLTLRGSLSARSRSEYERVLSGLNDAPGAAREDAWQRAVEFLFEHLAVSWEIAGLPIDGQRELLGRFRMASADERAWVCATLRTHLAEHFPEVTAP